MSLVTKWAALDNHYIYKFGIYFSQCLILFRCHIYPVYLSEWCVNSVLCYHHWRCFLKIMLSSLKPSLILNDLICFKQELTAFMYNALILEMKSSVNDKVYTLFTEVLSPYLKLSVLCLSEEIIPWYIERRPFTT